MLSAPTGIPVRPGIALETPFVGAGMRDQPELHYIPARLSLVPNLFAGSRPPDVVLVHTSMPYDGSVSMGCEVNILPAAIEAVRSRGGLVVAQVNPNMPYTYGDGVLGLNEVDLALEGGRAGQPDRGHQLVASVCFGSRAVYEFVHRNPQVRLRRTGRTNDPAV